MSLSDDKRHYDGGATNNNNQSNDQDDRQTTITAVPTTSTTTINHDKLDMRKDILKIIIEIKKVMQESHESLVDEEFKLILHQRVQDYAKLPEKEKNLKLNDFRDAIECNKVVIIVIVVLIVILVKLNEEDKNNHKDCCFKELNTNQLQIERNELMKEDLLAKAKDVEMTIKALDEAINVLRARSSETQVQLKRAGEDLENENREPQQAVPGQREIRKLTQPVPSILQDVYGKKAKEALLQKKEPTGTPPTPGFEEYGKNRAVGGVKGMIQQIISDVNYIAFRSKAKHDPRVCGQATGDHAIAHWREQLWTLYQRHAPQHLARFEEILLKYKGRERELHAALRSKYETDLEAVPRTTSSKDSCRVCGKRGHWGNECPTGAAAAEEPPWKRRKKAQPAPEPPPWRFQ